MSQDKKIRELLGLKQEEMAMILQITRSQWSMFEIGKRDLPHDTSLKLAEMILFISHQDDDSNDNFVDFKVQEAKKAKVFEGLKLLNKTRQIITVKKIKGIEKKYQSAMLALKLIRFLESNNVLLYTSNLPLFTFIKLNAENTIQKNGLHLQAKFKFKLKVLQQEEVLLNETLLEE